MIAVKKVNVTANRAIAATVEAHGLVLRNDENSLRRVLNTFYQSDPGIPRVYMQIEGRTILFRTRQGAVITDAQVNAVLEELSLDKVQEVKNGSKGKDRGSIRSVIPELAPAM